jgi:acetyl-CoA synthetase
VLITNTLPRTRSGKIMRRLLRSLMTDGTPTGDLSALENPDALEQIQLELQKENT